MKRLVMVTALLLGGVLSAHADNDTYNDVTKHARGDDVLHADTDYCAQRFGAPQNGTPTSRQFKRCMLGRKWRWQSVRITRTPSTVRHDCFEIDNCGFR